MGSAAKYRSLANESRQLRRLRMREHFILSVLMLTMSRSRDDVNVLSEPPKLLCSCNLTACAFLKLLAVESYSSNEKFFQWLQHG